MSRDSGANLLNIPRPDGTPSQGWYAGVPVTRGVPQTPLQPGPYFIDAVAVWDDRGFLEASLDLHLDTITISGLGKFLNSVEIDGNLSVGGSETLAGDLSVGGNETVGGTLTVNGNVHFLNNLVVGGNITSGSLNTGALVASSIHDTGPLTVDGLATFNDGTNFAGGATFGGDLHVNGCVIATCLEITGPTTLTGPVTINGDETVNGTITATGNITSSNGCVVAKCLEIDGPSTFNGNVTINGNETVNGTITATTVNATTVNGGTITGNFTGTFNGTFPSSVRFTSVITDDLDVTTTASFGGSVDIYGLLTLHDGLSFSGSLSTGGDITAGGCLIGNCLEVNNGGPSTLTGGLHLSGTAQLDSDLLVSGNSTINGDLGINANAVIAGDLEVDTNQVIRGDLEADGTLVKFPNGLMQALGVESLADMKCDEDFEWVRTAFSTAGILELQGGFGYQPGGGMWLDINSDERTKKDIVDFDKGLAEVMRMRPVRYRFNGTAGMKDDGRVYCGMIAQEVEPVMPEMVAPKPPYSKAVSDDMPSDLKTLNTTPLFYALVNAVKELATRVQTLEGAS
jgi:predicted acyltransferase (DUF342 family)